MCPCLLHEVQLHMVTYFQELLLGCDPPVLTYNYLFILMQCHSFSDLVGLSHKYQVTLSGKPIVSSSTGDSGTGGTSGDTTPTTAAFLGNQVTNAQPTVDGCPASRQSNRLSGPFALTPLKRIAMERNFASHTISKGLVTPIAARRIAIEFLWIQANRPSRPSLMPISVYWWWLQPTVELQVVQPVGH